MFKEVFSEVFCNMAMVSSFCLFMVFCMLSNTLLGIAQSLKLQTFDFKIMLEGILKNVIIILGINLLTAGISGVTKLIEVYDLATQYEQTIQDVSVITIVSIIITASYLVYGKQAIQKIKEINHIEE